MRAGLPSAYTASFRAAADGVLVLTWTLTNEIGTSVATGTITPVSGAISQEISVIASNNTLASGTLWGSRELAWSFNGQTGFFEYSLESRVPFGATADGVRTKLGLTDADLADEEIPLLKAYLTFRDTVGTTALAAVSSDLAKMKVSNAVEAMAALALLPTLQVRIAQKESSGTNQFERFKIDWEALAEVLRAMINEGQAAVDPTLVGVASGVSLLRLSTPAIDLFPGA